MGSLVVVVAVGASAFSVSGSVVVSGAVSAFAAAGGNVGLNSGWGLDNYCGSGSWSVDDSLNRGLGISLPSKTSSITDSVKNSISQLG